MQGAPIVRATHSSWRGVVMALLVGMSLAANTSLAAVAYSGGATPVAVLLARTTVAFIVLYLWLSLHGVRRSLPMPQRRIAIWIGCIFAAYSLAILVAIQTMPVGLVVATFYTFPLLIALVEWSSGREAFHWGTALAFVIAFVGIVFALDVLGGSVHGFAIVLCLSGAIGVTVVMTLSARARGDGDSRPVTLHMLGIALGLFVLLALMIGGVSLPHTAYAWFGFLGAPVFYTFGIITLFSVFADIGPVKASMIMNVEPVTSVVLGFVLLDQRLAIHQIFGIALVVGAVLMVEARQRRT